MGGKRLKFPSRKKFVSSAGDIEFKKEEESVSDEEHKKRLEMLKKLGLIKEESSSEQQ